MYLRRTSCIAALAVTALHCGAPGPDESAPSDQDSVGQLEGPLFGLRRRPRRTEPPPVAPPAAPGGGGEAPPAANAGQCPAAPLAPGNHNLSLLQGGVTRTIIVHVPKRVDGSVPVPLVVDLHGLTSSASAQAALSGWREKSDEEGFVVVHPQGLNASWNAGDLCCGTSQRQGVDDEGFIRALVARMEQDICIDAKRVYATGLSNGGAMSHLLACQTADLFAATAPVSMGNGTDPCRPSRPISIVMTRGTSDPLVPFDGGVFPSAQDDFDQWARLNGCRGTPQPANDLCQTLTDCNGGVEVKTCAVDAGHVLYDNAQNFSVPDVVWETFARQALP